jgi:hypothetical protein
MTLAQFALRLLQRVCTTFHQAEFLLFFELMVSPEEFAREKIDLQFRRRLGSDFQPNQSSRERDEMKVTQTSRDKVHSRTWNRPGGIRSRRQHDEE